MRAAVLVWLALTWCGLAGCSSEPPQSLVIVSLDTLRRDHLPTYGPLTWGSFVPIEVN